MNRRERLIQEIALAVAEVLEPCVAETFDKAGAARYLKLSISALEERMNRIPHSKPGRSVVFQKRDLQRYLEETRCGKSIPELVENLIAGQKVSRGRTKRTDVK